MDYKRSQWFTINYGEAAGAMKWIYENYKKALEKSRKNRQFVKTNFTIEKMSSKLGEILDRIMVGKWSSTSSVKITNLKEKDL